MQNHTKNNLILKPLDLEVSQQEGKINKVAIYHTGALGDLLVSTAAVYESIQLYPNAEFTIIGSKLWKEILSPNIWPNIKFILEVNNKKFTHLKLWKINSDKTSWEETGYHYSNMSSFLKNYSVTIDLRTESLRFAWRSLLAKVPVRVGRNKSKFSKLFFTNFTQEKAKKNFHERDRYLEVLLSLNEDKIKEKISYWNENGLPSLGDISNNTYKSLPEEKTVLINPTASIREKAWPSEKFRQLAFKLKEQGCEVVVIGSLRETDWLKEVSSEDFKITQPRNISELLQIVAQAKLLITNTSSMQFIAASTKTRTLTIMGSADPKKWGPLGDWSHYIKGEDLKMNSSLLKPKNKTGKLNEVLSYNSISVNSVFEMLLKLNII